MNSMENMENKIRNLNIYSEENIEFLMGKIGETTPEIFMAISQWLETGKMTETIVEDIRFLDLVEKFKMNPIAAYLTLDWISRSPIEAKLAIKKEYEI